VQAPTEPTKVLPAPSRRGQSNRISRPWARFSSRRAADAYQAAIDRLENSGYRNALAEFKRDHLRHITELGDILSRMGRTPPKEGDMKVLLTQRQSGYRRPDGRRGHSAGNADQRGGHQHGVRALRELQGLQANTRDVLQNGLADERRHGEWIWSS